MAINRSGTVTASTEGNCVGSLAAHLDKFAEFLAGEGYVSQTIEAKCALVAALSRWLKRRRVPLTKVNEARLKQFHARRSGSRRRGDVYTGCQLLEFLHGGDGCREDRCRDFSHVGAASGVKCFRASRRGRRIVFRAPTLNEIVLTGFSRL
jgi:hypothetical protein